jgi:hypothetical protein
MFVPEHLRTNAFRVLQLPAHATSSQVHAVAAKLRRSAALGLAPKSDDDLATLGPVARTEQDISRAVARLCDPVQRLTDRLFWFHLRPATGDAASSAISRLSPELEGAARSHDAAIHHLLAAIAAKLDRDGLDLSIDAIRSFYRVVHHPAHWALVSQLEARGGFEPGAVGDDIARVRSEACGLAGEHLVLAARDGLANRNLALVRAIVGALGELSETGSWAVRARDELTLPARRELDEACSALREQYGSKIERREGAAQRNTPICTSELAQLRATVLPALDRLLELVPMHDPMAAQAREQVALALHALGADFSWAENFVQAVALNEKALDMARDTPSRPRIEQALLKLRPIASRQRMFESPVPATTVSRRVAHRSEPIRVRHLVVAAVLLGMTALFIAAPHMGAQRTQNAPDNSFSAAERLQRSRTALREAERIKQQVEAGREQIRTLEAKLQPVIQELRSLETDIDRRQARLAKQETRLRKGEATEDQTYEPSVKAHNLLVRKHQRLLRANQADIDSYKQLVEEDKRLVLQYNGTFGALR